MRNLLRRSRRRMRFWLCFERRGWQARKLFDGVYTAGEIFSPLASDPYDTACFFAVVFVIILTAERCSCGLVFRACTRQLEDDLKKIG